MRSRSTAVLFVFLVSIFACCAFAQTFRGSIQGTVTDSTGSAIVGAQVRVFSPSTGFSRSLTTNERGEYQTSELPLGTYSITVEKTGFRTTTLNQIPVSVGSPARADAKLSTGQVKEQIEVNADVPLVETSSNTTGGTIDSTEAAELPINGRDFTKLLELVPGTASDPVGSTESAGSYGLFSMNGNRGRSNNYLLDGTDMNDGYRNLPSINQAGVWGCPSTILPVDALAEIPVTGSPEAEFGRSSGATVNIVTKSGSNQIHGTMFEYFRNDALGARNYFNSTFDTAGSVTQQPKNSFSNHQYGGSVGGPIVKDNLFWFAAFEGQRENGGLPQLGYTPTQSYINAFAATNTINPVIQNLLNRHPWGTLPTLADPTIDQVSTTFTTPFVNNSDNLILKLDQHLHLLSSNDLLTGRYFYSHGTQSFPLGMLNTGSSAPGFNTSTPTHVNIVSLSYTSLPKSNLIFELRGGYNRFLQDFLPQDINFDPTSIGLNTLPPGFSPSRDLGLPTISISSATGAYSPIGATGSDARGRIDTNYQLFGNVTYNKGRHSYKMGYEWRRTFINSFIDSGHRGKLSFSNLDDFLTGTIDGGGSAAGSGTRYSYQNNSGIYFQDSWRYTPRITVNYGIRWDYYGVVGAKNNAFSIFNVKTGTEQTVGASGGPKTLYPRDLNNFAPRVSVIDDLMGNGKLVLRSGVGIFYDGASQDFFVGNQPWNTSAAQAGPAFNNIGFSTSRAATIVAGQPVFGDYQPNSLFTVAQNLATPIYLSYNLNLESQLTKGIALEIGYVGSEGHHLFRFRDLDQFNNVAGRVVNCGNGTTISYGEQCFPNYYYINQEETTANSSYNSLQATLKLQNWHGFTSVLNYTWAHSIDNASDGLDFVPNAAQPDDSFNPRAERANSNFDVRNRVQWYFTYNIPNINRAKWITNGWAVDGNFNHATGQPFTLSYLFESDSTGADLNGSGEYFGRPDIVGNPFAGTHGRNQFLNLSAFAVPCTLDSTGACVANSQHPGNEGRNAFRAPNYTNFDFSLTKLSHLTERVTMQLRADFFNVFNHPNFSNPLLPGFAIDFLNGSSPASANRLGTGFLPLSSTPDVGSGNPYLGGGGPRTTQLAVRFSF
ncbi:MAG TPA: carboxypeptidase regulatory-like domain-containing protein [Candidatus Saccharimonadales bacterium]|nr:carboxypeptidase regulatory-like domain-containing protein [Candidatus Saccharimonadales bacterium]